MNVEAQNAASSARGKEHVHIRQPQDRHRQKEGPKTHRQITRQIERPRTQDTDAIGRLEGQICREKGRHQRADTKWQTPKQKGKREMRDP